MIHDGRTILRIEVIDNSKIPTVSADAQTGGAKLSKEKIVFDLSNSREPTSE